MIYKKLFCTPFMGQYFRENDLLQFMKNSCRDINVDLVYKPCRCLEAANGTLKVLWAKNAGRAVIFEVLKSHQKQ